MSAPEVPWAGSRSALVPTSLHYPQREGAALALGLVANAVASNGGNGCTGCVGGFAAAAAGGGVGLGAIPGNRTIYRIKK